MAASGAHRPVVASRNVTARRSRSTDRVPRARGELVALAEHVIGGRAAVRAFRFDPTGTWGRVGDADVPVTGLARTTIAAAGASIMLLPPQGVPTSLHVPSGEYHQRLDAAIQGIGRPGVVWTGTQLIIWGGVVENADGIGADGVIWNPR